MAGDRKLIAVYEIQMGTSKQNLEGVSAAEREMSEAGTTAASSLTNAFEGLEARTDKMFATMEKGGAVSTTQLRSLAGQYVALGDNVTKAFGSIENAPAAIQTAMQTAEEQVLAVNTAVSSVGARVNDVAERFAALGAAATEAATAAAEGVQGIAEATDAATTAQEGLATAIATAAGAFTTEAGAAAAAGAELEQFGPQLSEIGVEAVHAQAAIDKFYADIEENGYASKSVIKQINNAMLDLRESITTTAGTINQATPGEIANYQRLQAAVAAVIAKQGEYTESLRVTNAQIALASGKTVSAEMALETLAGGYGSTVVKGFLFAGMLGIAAEATKKFAEALDKDGAAAKFWEETVGTSFEKVKEDAYEIGASFAQLAATAVTWGHTGEDSAKATDELGYALLRLGARLDFDKESQKLLTAAQNLGIDAIELYELKTKDATAVLEFYNKTLLLGAAGENIRARAMQASGGDTQKLVEYIHQHVKALEDEIKKYPEAVKAVQNHEEELKHQIKTLQDLINKYDDEVAKIGKVVAAIGTEQDARERLHKTIQQEIEDGAKHEVSVNGTTKSIQNLGTTIGELSARFDENKPFIEEEIRRLDGLTHSGIAVSDAVKKASQSMSDSASEIQKLDGANRQLRTELDATAKAFDALTPAEYAERQAKEAQITANKFLIEQLQQRIATEAQVVSAVKASTEADQASSAATISITKSSGEATDAQHKLKSGVVEVSSAARSSADSIGDMHRAQDSAQDSAETLATAGEKSGKALGSQAENANSSATALGDLATKAIPAGTAIKMVGDESTKAEKPGDSYKKVMVELGVAFKETTDRMEEQRKKLAELETQYDRVTSAAGRHIAILKELDTVSAAAAGTSAEVSTSGNNTPRSQG